MVFFDANKFDVQIELDGNGVFVVGATISGRIVVTCTEQANIRGISFSYRVMKRVLPVLENAAMVLTEGQLAKQGEDDIDLFDSTPLHHMSYLLVGNRSSGQLTMTPGRFVYPFCIPVHPGMPGSIPGGYVGDDTTCCKCCCFCCGGKRFFFSLMHVLSVKVIIPYSFKDKHTSWPITVLRAAHPQQVLASAPFSVSTGGAIHTRNCLSCCPGCGCRDPSTTFEGTLSVPKVTYAFGHDPVIPFTLIGHAGTPLQVQLVRRFDPTGIRRHAPFRDIKSVIAHVRVPFAGGHGGPVHFASVLPIDASRTKHFHTAQVDQFSVSYWLEVQLDVSAEGSCGCTGIAEDEVLKLPVQLLQCVHEAATYVPAPAPQPGRMMSYTTSGYYLEMPWGQASALPLGMPEMFAYAPPAGGQGYAPIGPVSEALPAAVWASQPAKPFDGEKIAYGTPTGHYGQPLPFGAPSTPPAGSYGVPAEEMSVQPYTYGATIPTTYHQGPTACSVPVSTVVPALDRPLLGVGHKVLESEM